MQILNSVAFEMNAQEIQRRLGISADSEDWHNVQEIMQEMNKTIQAQAAYKPCYIQQKKNETVTIENINFSSKVLRKNLEEVQIIFPFVVSLGKNVDEMLKKKDDFIQQYYLDTIANVALQDLLQSLCAHLQSEYNIEQLSYMSPGSLQDWPIEQQRPLFMLLGNVEGEIGVRLAPSMLMHPSKSESGMFFPTEVTFFNCQLCPHANCPSRKAAYDEEKAREYGVL